MADTNGQELSWDSEIEKDNEFYLVPDGDYNFVVIQMDRARHNGSEKLPPCNKAILKIRLSDPETGNPTINPDTGEPVQITHQLFLHSNMEGRLCEFFASIGHREKGERIKMDFDRVEGSRGKLKIGHKELKRDNGDPLKFNEIKKFYEAPKTSGGYTPGKF